MGLLNEGQGQPQGQAPQAPQQAPQAASQGAPQDSDAVLQQALDHLGKALYESKADEKIAAMLRDMKGAPQIMASIAYKATQGADTATNGDVAEEDLPMLAVAALSEVAELAETTGVEVTEAMLSQAMKAMIVMFVEDHGGDPQELQAAFANISDDEFASFAQEASEKELDEAALDQADAQEMGEPQAQEMV